MNKRKSVGTPNECAVCLGVHDEEIHNATVTIHLWLRREIARRTYSEQLALPAIGTAVTPSVPSC